MLGVTQTSRVPIEVESANEFSFGISTMPDFIPRSGYVLQPNVAALRLRWVQAYGRGRNHRGCVGSEFDTQGSRGGNPGL